jgi:hypothetical protein
MQHTSLSILFTALVGGSAFAQCFSVTTLTTSGNGQNGVMFDIVNTSAGAINIGSFDECFFSGASSNMYIYTKVGTYNGSETNPAAWTLVAGPVVTPHGVAPALDPIPIVVNVTIPAAGIQGFYLTGDAATTVAYTTGVNQLGTVIGSNADLQVICGVGNAYPFGATFGQPTAGRLFNGRVNYCPLGAGTVLATNTTLGAGCLNVADVSSYENFATAASFDLSNTAITFLRNGTGYTAIPGITTYVAPSGSATVLALSDDSEISVTLTSPMPFGASGLTNTLTVCSNGYVSSASGNGVGFSPAPATFLNGPQAWWSLGWHDFNPGAVGSGQVKFEQIGSIAYITWDGVWDFGGTAAANASTMQAQFDTATGTVHYVYGTMSTLGNGFLTGYSEAGASADPGSMDISVALPATYTAAVFHVLPLALSAASRPITGTSWNLNVSSIPATGLLGVEILGLSDPGINDLFFIGMPGCGLRANLDVLNAFLVAGATHAWSFNVPNNVALLNLHVYATSAVAQVPPVNAFGFITSNGIDGLIGDF